MDIEPDYHPDVLLVLPQLAFATAFADESMEEACGIVITIGWACWSLSFIFHACGGGES